MRSAVLYVAVGLAILWVVIRLTRRYADRSAARALLRHRARVDRFKLASRAHVRAQLLADPVIAAAVREHAHALGVTEAAALARVNEYVEEIVPFFNVIAYFQIGYRVSRIVLNLFYKVTVE